MYKSGVSSAKYKLVLRDGDHGQSVHSKKNEFLSDQKVKYVSILCAPTASTSLKLKGDKELSKTKSKIINHRRLRKCEIKCKSTLRTDGRQLLPIGFLYF